MPRGYNKIRYMMENQANIETIKNAYTKFRVEGYPAGYVNQPARGPAVPASLNPFCLYGYTTKYVVKMTGRAKTQMTVLGISEAELNVDTGAAGGTVTGKKAPSRFGAAKMVVFVPVGDTAYKADTGTTTAGQPVTEDTDKTPVSAVRGLKYNRRLGNSYTLPFGASNVAGQQTQLDMQGYLYIKGAKGGRSVSFKPERPG